MKISLVIPCYNEEGNIDSLVKKCERFLSSKKNQLVLVNNGSSDNTEKKINEYSSISNLKKVNVSKNQGFGYGILQGLLASSGDILSYTHADKKGIAIKNLIHASANEKDAKKEIKLWFKSDEIHSYRSVHDTHISE